MEFGIEKSALLITKSGKRHMMVGIEQTNQEEILTLGEKPYRYLEILEANAIKQVDERINNERVSQVNQKDTRHRDKYLGCLFIRYSGPLLKWTREELIQMEQRTRKLKTMHKALHSGDDADRLYVSRKGGKRLTSIEKRRNKDHPDYCICKIGQNTEKSPGDFRRLAVT